MRSPRGDVSITQLQTSMDRSRAVLRLLRQCHAIESPTLTRTARLSIRPHCQRRHFQWTSSKLEEPKIPGQDKTEIKDEPEFGKEKLSFRGQLYKRTTERLEREREGEDRFRRMRDHKGIGAPLRVVSVTISMLTRILIECAC